MHETAYIYALCNPATGEIRYIGKTHSPIARLRDHLKERGNTSKTAWIKKCKRTIGKPIMEIIESFPHALEHEWQQAERFWISYLRFLGCRLTNEESGGIGGKLLSETTKQKLCAANTGKRLSKETKLKQSIALRGKFVSEETKRKISLAHKARIITPQESAARSLRISINASKMSAVTRAIIADKMRGRKHSEETKRKMSAIKIGISRPADVVAKVADGNRGQKRTPEQVERFAEVQREVWARRNAGLLPPRKERCDSVRKRLALSLPALDCAQMPCANP